MTAFVLQRYLLYRFSGVYFSATKRDIIKFKTYNVEYLYQKMFPELSKKVDKRNVVVYIDCINLIITR